MTVVMTDGTTMRATSAEELVERRALAERVLRGAIEAFVLLPIEHNLIAIVTDARNYQAAWMNDVAARVQDQPGASA